jgi:hypothetical protein
MPCLRRTLAALVVLIGALAAATSRATPTDALERARRLFVQAEADEDAERWSDALDKLHAVAQVKLTAGIRYHLALCEQHIGQLARALSDYRAAEEHARIENAKDVLRLVGQRLAELEPRVPRLTIHVVPALPEASVRLDGESIARPLAGIAILVDPGVHRVEATAPGRPASTVVVTLHELESTSLDVHLTEPTLPPSTPTPPSMPPSTPAPVASETTFPRQPGNHALAIVATAVTVALAGGGAAAYVAAGDEHDRALRTCAQVARPGPGACDWLVGKVRAWDFAAAGAWGSAILMGAIALVLWARPTDAPTTPGARLMVGPAVLGMEGRF